MSFLSQAAEELVDEILDLFDRCMAQVDVRAQIYQRHPKESLQAAIEESERLLRPADDNYFDFLTSRYRYVRQFAPLFLSTFTFRANRRGEPLVEATTVLRQIKRKVPDNAPGDFIPAKWQPSVLKA